MTAQIFDAPLLIKVFFLVIFASSATSVFYIIGGALPPRGAASLRAWMQDAPLLSGFGGTIASLYISVTTSFEAFELKTAFATALSTTIYGVVVSLLGFLACAMADRREPRQ